MPFCSLSLPGTDSCINCDESTYLGLTKISIDPLEFLEQTPQERLNAFRSSIIIMSSGKVQNWQLPTRKGGNFR